MDLGLFAAGRDRLSLAANHRADAIAAEDGRNPSGRPERRNADRAPGPRRPPAAVTGKRPVKLLIALLAAAGLAAGLLGNLFGNHPYTVTAYFLSAEGLTPENQRANKRRDRRQ